MQKGHQNRARKLARQFVGSPPILASGRTRNQQNHLEVQSTEGDARGRIIERVNELVDTITRQALSDLRNMMTDDVTLVTASGPPTVGRDAIEAYCRNLFDRFVIHDHHVDFRLEVIEGENAACAYLYPMVKAARIDDGDPATVRGRVSAILRRENGTWRLARVLIWASSVEGI